MIVNFPVADAMWLAVCCPPAAGRLRGRELRAADRAAARSAWDLALRATGLSPGNATGSCAHTEGAGAALVGPKGRVLGVDLVSPARVTVRHARAILDPHEWEALPGPLVKRGALGWGLKEAAAKALGSPVRDFPAGLGITYTANGLEVIARHDTRWSLAGHWREVGSLLCVWVIELARRQAAPRASPT